MCPVKMVHVACRVALMEEGRASAPARETMSTAELDNRGLMQLQQDTMSRQDNELEELERSVNSTKVGPPPQALIFFEAQAHRMTPFLISGKCDIGRLWKRRPHMLLVVMRAILPVVMMRAEG